MNTVALDIGGTKIYAARYAESVDAINNRPNKNELQSEQEIKIPTGKTEPEVLKNIIQVIHELKTEETKAIGIAFAGPIKNGIIQKAPNIDGFTNFPLKQEIRKEFQMPIVLENDARSFAYAEAKLRNIQNLVGITLGTGVGGGIIINGFPQGWSVLN